MNKLIKIILMFFFICFSVKSYSQLGLQAGYIYSGSKGNLELGQSNHFSGTFRNHGFQAGLTYDFRIKGDLSLQTGLLYSYLGGSTTEKKNRNIINTIYNQVTASSIYQYLDLPIRVAYALPVTNEFKIFFFGGPNLTYGLSAKISDISLKGNYNGLPTINNSIGDYDVYKEYDKELSRFDLKLGFGGGVQYKHLRMKVGYDFGVLNLYNGVLRKNQSGDVNKLRRGQFGVSLSYIFGK